MVATAMSNVRRVTFTSPDPLTYTRSAVATIGILDYTQGYWPHAFMVIFSMRNLATVFFVWVEFENVSHTFIG